MGVIYGYFAAADDDDAVRAVVREDGEPTATGYDGFDVNGMDPTTDLLPAEAALTGRSAETVQGDPRHGHLLASIDEGDLLCLTLTDSLRDALTDADQSLLREIAREWATSDVFWTPPGSGEPDRIPHTDGRLGQPGGGGRTTSLLLDLRLTSRWWQDIPYVLLKPWPVDQGVGGGMRALAGVMPPVGGHAACGSQTDACTGCILRHGATLGRDRDASTAPGAAGNVMHFAE